MKSLKLRLSRSVATARALCSGSAHKQSPLPVKTRENPNHRQKVPRVWNSIAPLLLATLAACLLEAVSEDARGADALSYLLSEGFEGVGFENPGWTKTGTPDEDYASGALDGLQSLRCLGGQQIARSFPFSDSFYFYSKVRFLSLPTFQGLIFWRNAFGNTVAELYFNNTFGNVELIHGSTIVTSSNLFVAETTYDLWIEWTKGTGSDGTMKLYVATDGIKPQSPQVSIDNGTGGATDRLIIGPENPARGDVVFDLILVDDVPIGDNPGGSQNHPPSISRISNQTITEGSSTGPISFTIDDIETASGSLVVSGTSSNPTLVPDANIILSGSGSNRSVNITPEPNQNGNATITLTVSDGQAATSTSFSLVVQAATGPTYLLDEDFEGAGFQNAGWSKIGTPNEDYTALALHGLESLNCTGGQRVYRTFAFADSFYLYFKVRFIALPTFQALIDWRNTSLARVAQMYVNGGTVNLAHGTVFATSHTAFTTDTTYDVWIEWTKGSGSDGTFKLFLGTDGTKPETPDIDITAGDGGPINRIEIGPESSGNVVFDRILVDDVPIGNPAPPTLTVTIADATRTYGMANPPFTGNLTGLRIGDNITATYTSAATINAPVGGYDIVPVLSDPDGRLSGYIVVTNVGTLTITTAELTVSANDASRPYGATNPQLTGTLSGLRNGDNITATYSSAASPASPVGEYTIQPALGDAESKLSNYSVSTHNGKLTVTPAVLIGQVDEKGRPYGAANPPSTVTYSGFVNGEDATVLTGTLDGFTPAGTNSPPGIYPITLSGQSASNYIIEYRSGTLIVTGAVLEISIDKLARSYGAANPPLTGNISGVENGDNITASYTGAATPLSASGIYPIMAVVNDPDGKLGNYNLVVHQGTLTVTQAVLSVSADDKARVVGGANPPLTGTITGIQNGDNITATYSTPASSLSLPGNYPITPTLNDSDNKLANYQVHIRNGTLTVTLTPGGSPDDPPPLIITADDQTRSYATSNPPFTGTITGLQNGDNITASYTAAATLTSPAGIYAITAVLNDPDGKLGKYRLITHNGTLTVTPAPLSVFVDDQSRPHGATNPPLTGTISGSQLDDNITGTYTTAATSNSPVGSYPITTLLNDLNGKLDNYAVSIRNGLLTVTPGVGEGEGRPIRITALALSNNHAHLTGTADANTIYTIQASEDLIEWRDIGTALTDGDGHFEFEDSSNSVSVLFFRVVLR